MPIERRASDASLMDQRCHNRNRHPGEHGSPGWLKSWPTNRSEINRRLSFDNEPQVINFTAHSLLLSSSNHSPLKSSALSRIPFLRPSSFTASSVAGIVRLLRGEMQIPVNTLGASFAGLSVPRSASPLRIIGE
jgi:hypothetical protein